MAYELPFDNFLLIPPDSPSPSSLVLEQPSKTPGGSWRFSLSLLSSSQLRVVLGRSTSVGTMEGGLKRKEEMPTRKMEGLEINEAAKIISFSLPQDVQVTLSYSTCPILNVVDSAGRTIHRDFTQKGYCFEGSARDLARPREEGDREGGVSWYTEFDQESVCLGLGEKAAPINLSRRKFEMRATNAAHYDAFNSDPLYKQLPFLLILSNPNFPKPTKVQNAPPPFATGIFSPSAAAGMWSLGCDSNDPLGKFKKFTQTEGALDATISWGATGQEVKDGWRTLLESEGGARTLIGRQWLGYLASTLGQAESDSPPAQELLALFPETCKKHRIPCSAMHLSSGYTVDKKDGYRKVFTWNKDRYPDFEGLMQVYHRSGIKVAANIKPYISHLHPHFSKLRDANSLFRDPATGKLSSTQVWSGLTDSSSEGSWVDMTSIAGREWWAAGVKDVLSRGVDAMWNDDNEFTIVDHSHTCKWELPPTFTNAGPPGPKAVGSVGGIVNCELVGQVSKQTTEAFAPGRRPFILTRSANVGSLNYITSSWSGDNFTSWKTFRGNISQGLNSGVSFLHSYGDDIGGFAGPLPSPELFLRWVQSAAYRSRFCELLDASKPLRTETDAFRARSTGIHSFKPTPDSPHGGGEVNEPWMYPEILPEVRAAIERRYELIPYLYALSWEATELGKALMTWSGWDQFERDPKCYEEDVLDGQDFWLGTGKVLVAGCYYPGVTSRQVYLPSSKASGGVDEGYYDLNTGFFHSAGTTVITPTPFNNIAVFVRAGTIIPIGKPCVTITSSTGLPSTTADGTRIVLKSEGGVVELDDYRGIEIFPPPPSSSSTSRTSSSWSWEWNEDDGESHQEGLAVSRIRVDYAVVGVEEVEVTCSWVKREFKTLWEELWVVLPKGDARVVRGGEPREWRGRRGFVVSICS